MKKLLICLSLIITIKSYSQTGIVVGGLFGRTQTINSNVRYDNNKFARTNYKNNQNYGIWITYKNIGFLYSKSGNFGYALEDIVGYNNPPGSTRHLGSSSKNLEFTVDAPYKDANIETQNIGGYYVFNSGISKLNYYGGVVIQTNKYHELTPSNSGGRIVNGILYNRYTYTLDEKSNVLPGVIVGGSYKINSLFLLNSFAILSHTSSLNIGVGIVIE